MTPTDPTPPDRSTKRTPIIATIVVTALAAVAFTAGSKTAGPDTQTATPTSAPAVSTVTTSGPSTSPAPVDSTGTSTSSVATNPAQTTVTTVGGEQPSTTTGATGLATPNIGTPTPSTKCGIAPETPVDAHGIPPVATDRCTIDEISSAVTTALVGTGTAKAAAIRGGDQLGDVFTAASERLGPLDGKLTITIDGMMWYTTTLMTVRWSATADGAIVFGPVDSGAVLVNGEWKLGRVSYCAIVATFSQNEITCPADPDNGRYAELTGGYTNPNKPGPIVPIL